MIDVDTTAKPPVGISLCTGMRGLEKGVEWALRYLRYGDFFFGETQDEHRVIQIAATVEIEAFVALNLVREMEEGLVAPGPVWTDLKTFPFERFHAKVHGFFGGYPCQPFSSAGKQHGVLDPRHLFPYIDRGIESARPIWCWFENVANHLNIGYQEVRGRLQTLGYTVEEGIFSAEQVGAPHLRKRLFVLAVANPYCTEQAKRRGDLAEVLGVPKTKRQSEYCASLLGRNGAELGHSHGLGEQQPGKREGRGWAGDTGEELENPEVLGVRGGNHGDSGRQGWPLQTTGSGSQLDNSEFPRLQGLDRHESLKARWQKQIRSIAQTGLWPAGQGQYQFEYEPPRLESSVGYDVDGYDFVQDLLRMAGNAVVPQQSCAAFLTLIRKFGVE